jgi:hypothetical protein
MIKNIIQKGFAIDLQYFHFLKGMAELQTIMEEMVVSAPAMMEVEAEERTTGKDNERQQLSTQSYLKVR